MARWAGSPKSSAKRKQPALFEAGCFGFLIFNLGDIFECDDCFVWRPCQAFLPWNVITACEKPLLHLVVFIFEHFFYSKY